MWALTAESHQMAYTILLFVMLCAVFRAAFDAPSKEPDRVSVAEYIGLVVVLSLATLIQAPIP